MFPGNFAPRFWTFCSGQTIAIAQNSALFAILGCTYGGDCRSTFGMPDLRGRSPLHVGGSSGTGPGLTTHVLGQRGGFSRIHLIENQLPSHTHELSPAGNLAPDELNPENNYKARAPGIFNEQASDLVAMNQGVLGVTGGTAAHQNRQPSLTINFIICEFGVFPPRN